MRGKNIIDSKKFKEFFFYGIENKKEVIEGILCFSANKIYKRHSLENWYAIPNEQFEKEIIQEAAKKYRQFYRFVTLNDVSNNEILDVSIQDLEKELEEEMQELKREKKVIDTKAGVFFIREREEVLKGGQKYIYGEGLKGEDGWTKQIYDILEKFEYMEEEDTEEYDSYLFTAKFARAIHRFDREEALKVKKIYENLRKRENRSIEDML